MRIPEGLGGSGRVWACTGGYTRAQYGTRVCGMERVGGCVSYGRVRKGTEETRGCKRVKDGAEG